MHIRDSILATGEVSKCLRFSIVSFEAAKHGQVDAIHLRKNERTPFLEKERIPTTCSLKNAELES